VVVGISEESEEEVSVLELDIKLIRNLAYQKPVDLKGESGWGVAVGERKVGKKRMKI
jgi:hypothetical protein